MACKTPATSARSSASPTGSPSTASSSHPIAPTCFHQKVINASMGSFARVRTHTADLAAALAATTAPILGCDLAG
jgi:hypothetical protein